MREVLFFPDKIRIKATEAKGRMLDGRGNPTHTGKRMRFHYLTIWGISSIIGDTLGLRIPRAGCWQGESVSDRTVFGG